ncbi:MAG: response regulator, partial [Nitrososphaeraceae archaeon]
MDDEYELVCLFKDMLSTIEGLEVYGFTSPSDAFEHIRLNVLNYDLVLSDLKLPEITGIELLTKIKELKPSVKALLMSAFDIQDDELFNEGKTRNIVNKFLQKPIKMDVLI